MAGHSYILSPAETARWTRVGTLAALAIALGYLETFIPLPIPGVKLGLANIAVLVALAQRDVAGAFCVAAIKVLAAGLLFGNPLTLAFSSVGTALAFAVMAPLSQLKTMHLAMTSVVGAIAHEAGQLLVAMLVLGTPLVWYSAPVLLIAGCATGLACGFLATKTVQLVESGDVTIQSERPLLLDGSPSEQGGFGRTGVLPARFAKPALLAFLGYLVIVLHASSLWFLGIGLAVATIACLIARIPGRAIVWALRPLALILAITLVAQAACFPDGPPIATLGPLVISADAAHRTAIMVVRLLDITAASVAIMYLVGTEALIDSIAWLLQPLAHRGIRTQGFVLALRVALQTVPSLAQGVRMSLAESNPATWRETLPLLIAQACREPETSELS